MTIVLYCSPKTDGHLMRLTRKFIGENNCKFIDVFNLKIEPCIDCGLCDELERCFMHDTDNLLKKIAAADRIIVASPTHNYTFPSPMLSFFSRLQPYYKSDIAKTKTGVLLVTAGTSGKYSFDIMKRQTRVAFDELGIESVGDFLFNHTDERDDLTDEEKENLHFLSHKFFD